MGLLYNFFAIFQVRTKDRTFDSVSHLINHHRDNGRPIISAESALRLVTPVRPSRKIWGPRLPLNLKYLKMEIMTTVLVPVTLCAIKIYFWLNEFDAWNILLVKALNEYDDLPIFLIYEKEGVFLRDDTSKRHFHYNISFEKCSKESNAVTFKKNTRRN